MIRFQLRTREYRELQALAEQTDDAVALQRARALLWMREGLSVLEIAQLLQVTRQTIYNWAQMFQNRVDGNLIQRLQDAPRTGRPGTALGIIDPLIDAIIDHDPRDYGYRSTAWTAELLKQYLNDVHAITTSRKSVSRALGRLGIRWKRPRHRLSQRLDTWRQSKGGLKTA